MSLITSAPSSLGVLSRPINRWWTVVSGFLGMMLGAALLNYMYNIFSGPMGAEFGWSRSSIALGLTVFLIAEGIGLVCLGSAIDRWGPRRVAATMVFAYGLCMATVALLPPFYGIYLTLFALMGFCAAAGTAVPYAVAVTAWFDKRRGLALGLVTLGGGVGGSLTPFFASYLLQNFGWRGVFVGIGLIIAVVPVTSLILLIRMPQSYEEQRKSRAITRTKSGPSLPAIMRTSKHFWLIAAAIFIISVATFGVQSQVIALATDRGIPLATAVGILSLSALSSMGARVVVGYVLDRWHAPYVAAGIFVLSTIGILAIAYSPSESLLMLSVILLGIGLGAEGDILAYLVGRYFPLASFGRVVGVLTLMWAWGGAVGTYFMGLSFDLTDSYLTAVWTYSVLMMVAVVALLKLGPYLYKAGHDPKPDAREAETPVSAS